MLSLSTVSIPVPCVINFNKFFLTVPTAEQLVDLHNQLSLLQWENQQQKIEIQNLRNGISAFQQNEAVLTQTIQQQKLVIEDLRNGAEAANSGVVNQLEQQVVKFQGKLAENSVMLRQYWRIIRAKDIVILDLQMENGRCNSKKELLKKELKVAKEVLRYHQCFPAFVQQLDPSAAAPSSIPKLTIKRAKTAPPLSRLKLANPFIPITEDEKENT